MNRGGAAPIRQTLGKPVDRNQQPQPAPRAEQHQGGEDPKVEDAIKAAAQRRERLGRRNDSPPTRKSSRVKPSKIRSITMVANGKEGGSASDRPRA